ncbi:MAG: von Willebrand factor type A domain-containing protein [Candidatus Eisenbacteria bacterium]
MKETLERCRPRLDEGQRRRILARLRAERSGRGFEAGEPGLRRWGLSFGFAVVAVAVVALLLIRESRTSREEDRPEEATKTTPIAHPAVALEVRTGEGAVPSRLRIGRTGLVPPFQDPRTDSVSTFALSIGTGSYEEAMEWIDRGALPPPEAVRIEEFVNRFRQGYPVVSRGDFALHVDGSPSPFRIGRRVIRIGVRARGDAAGDAEPVARSARLEVRFDPRSVSRYRLLGFDRPPGLRSEEPVILSGTEVAALYEVELRRVEPAARLLEVRLDYQPVDGRAADREETETLEDTLSRVAFASDVARPFEISPARYRLSVIAGTFAEMLRGGGRIEEGGIADLLPFAQQLAQELRQDPEVAAFERMVDSASRLHPPRPPS